MKEIVMKMLGHLSASCREVRADEVKVGDRLAGGRYQDFSLANVGRHGEAVIEVDYADGLVYVTAVGAPNAAYALEPHETLMLEVEN